MDMKTYFGVIGLHDLIQPLHGMGQFLGSKFRIFASQLLTFFLNFFLGAASPDAKFLRFGCSTLLVGKNYRGHTINLHSISPAHLP